MGGSTWASDKCRPNIQRFSYPLELQGAVRHGLKVGIGSCNTTSGSERGEKDVNRAEGSQRHVNSTHVNSTLLSSAQVNSIQLHSTQRGHDTQNSKRS